MGVFIPMRSMRVCLSLCLLFCLTFSTPFSSLAVTASDSNADQVASDSNADPPLDDYVEEDEFDTVGPVSDGDEGYPNVIANVYSGSTLITQKSGIYSGIQGDYYLYKFPRLSSGQYYDNFCYKLYRADLPSSGTYGVTYKFLQGATDISVSYAYIHINSAGTNVAQSGISTDVDYTMNSSGLYTCTGNVKIDRTVSNIELKMRFDSKRVDIFEVLVPMKQPYKFTYAPQDGATALPPGDAGNSGTTAIENNTAQMVEKQDTIIDQIMNVTQTISSQLTAFWNQLAGEFTNLYNKMNTQHSEQMQSDQDTRDTIREEEEKSRNFIVDGIIEGLKSLFIPSDEYFKSWFDDMYSFFSDRLGFLMLPIDLLVQLVGIYTGADSSFAGIPFPEFKWLDGTVIIPAQTVGFTFLETEWGQEIQSKLYFVGNVIMIGALLNLMHRKLEEVLRN